jgi:uncharacterized protein (TIGR03435 family)
MRQVVIAAVLLTAAQLAAAQTPSFEAASVKPAPPQTGPGFRVSMGGDPGRINYRNASFKQLVTKAYGLKDYQVSGPAWIETERYDVTATMPRDTPKETMQLMLQNLLAERFQLRLHRESKELPAYALVVAKGGPKLKEAEAAPGAANPKGGMMIMRPGKLEANGMDLGAFANLLANMVGRPVLDMTELKGTYDCTLEFTMDGLGMPMMRMATVHTEGGEAPPESSGPSLFTALQEQLGLKLEGRKAPLDILVIDSAEKIPTEN